MRAGTKTAEIDVTNDADAPASVARRPEIGPPASTTSSRGAASIFRELAGRLTRHEWRRRLVHMAPGVLPLALLAIPHRDPLTWFVRMLMLAVTVGFVAFALAKSGLFKRRDEESWAGSVVSYAIVTLTMLMVFPAQPELGLAVTVVMAFGDGSATLIGLMARGRRLPWNADKSWAGLGAFLTCAIPLATLVYWKESRPGVSLPIALACVVPAVLAAALVESLPTRINDNIRVGVAAGLTILITHGWLVGW